MSGESGKTFCAGGDIKACARYESREKFIEFKEKVYSLHPTFANMLPTQIAIWDGYVMGEGVGIS